jgi:hypothetical protein
MKSRSLERCSLSIVALCLLLLSGCGWQDKMSFPAPDGGEQVVILETWPDNSWGFRIELAALGTHQIVFERKRESFIYFIHVYWSADSTTFAVVATGLTQIQFAYDVKHHQEIPFDRLRAATAASIRAEYHLDRDSRGDPIDPLDWARTSPAHFAFTRLHPRAGTNQ